MKTSAAALIASNNSLPGLWLKCLIVSLLAYATTVLAREPAPAISENPSASSGREIVKRLQSLDYPKQIAQAQSLCTGPGWSILVRLTADSRGFFHNFNLRQVKSNPDLMDVQLVRDTADGRSVIWVRLLDVNGVWKLNNVKFEKLNGFKINLWAQYIYRHPQALQQRLAEYKRAPSGIAWQNVNEKLNTVKTLLDIVVDLKNLSDHKG